MDIEELELSTLIISFIPYVTFALVMLFPIFLSIIKFGVFKYDRISGYVLYVAYGLILHGLVWAGLSVKYGTWYEVFTSIGSGFLLLVLFRLFCYKSLKNRQLLYNLRKDNSGVETNAKVVNIRETGTMVHNQPVCILDLEYYFSGQTFTGEVKEVIPFTKLATIQVGITLKVLLDPNEPKNFGLSRGLQII